MSAAVARDLNVYQDGKGRNLMDWIREKGEIIYTEIGRRTWRVPPVKFNMQKLSEQKLNRKENDQQFTRIEGRVLGQPNVTDQETNRAENAVCGAFESLSNCLVQKGLGSAMFLISNFEYDNYLNKVSSFITTTKCEEAAGNQTKNVVVETVDNSEPTQTNRPVVKLPKDVARRGELDILILHQEAGVILVQTKAVGYNFFDKASQFERCNSVQTAIEKAGEQLSRDRNVMLYIMEDLGLTNDQITAVVALPNLPRSILLEEMSSELKHKVRHEFNLDLDTNFLCAEDFKPNIDGCHSELERWWRSYLLPSAKGMDLPAMQQIAYRTVGLLSTVSVWSYAQPRIEVRNWNEAAWETGNRYTQVVLSPQQVELLKHDDQYLYLWGPAGSGKTLLLSLKGRQWLRRDCNVAILNTRLGSRGRTVGQVIETTINKSEGLKRKAIRIDLDLMDNEETLSSIVADHVKGQTFYFLLDEVAWVKETEKLLSLLKKSYPYSSIWCAGMLIECQPEGFETGSLQVILRCPPSVQRVLRIVDNRDERYDLYKLDSAKAGLPTDGLPAFFVIHSRHGDSSVQPYDCPMCAKELSDFLINHLNMKSRTMSQDGSETSLQGCTQSAGSISRAFESEHNKNCSHNMSSSLGSDSGCDVDYCGKDNTDAEIDIIHDKNETDPCGNERTKSVRKKPQKKNKKNLSSVENINPNERISTRVINTSNMDATLNCAPSSEVQNRDKGIATKKSNQDEVFKPDSGTTSTKTKSKKSTRNQNSKTVNEYEDSIAIKCGTGNSRNNQNCTTISQCENAAVPKSSKENSSTNQNGINVPSSTVSKKRKSCAKKGNNNNNNTTTLDSLTDCASYPRLNFSDAVLPVTVPRAWHHYNSRGYWSLSRDALAQEMVLLGSSAFCQELYYSGVPLKVEEQMVMKAEGKELENNFVMCPVGAVHGLEYKLVVCVPSACALPEYIEIIEGIRHGKMEPKVLMKRTPFATDYLKKLDEPAREQHSLSEVNGNSVPKIDKVRISTHVAEQGAPYDYLYEPVPESDLSLISKEDLICSETNAGSQRPYVAPTYTDAEKQKFKAELCGHCDDKDKCVCQYFQSDELAALHRLDAWNKAYVHMCASRCTSTLVLVLP